MGVHKTDIDRGTKRDESNIPLYCSSCHRVCWFHTPHDNDLDGGLQVKSCWECDRETKYRQMDFDVPADTVMLDEHMSPLSKAEVGTREPVEQGVAHEEDDDDSTAFSF